MKLQATVSRIQARGWRSFIWRVLTMEGDAAKARATYQDFFVTWKDADPGLPLLAAAKAEYAKLQ